MAIFVYRAVDLAGRISRGRMPALNERELEGRLRNNGLEVITATQLIASRGGRSRGRIGRTELINFCFHMEQTLRGGVPITESIADLIEGLAHRGFRDVLAVCLEAVREGAPLSSALATFPNTFDEVFIGLIRSGEESGRLPDAFARVGARLRWIDELSSQIKKMVAYPAFTVVVLAAVTAFLLIYLVPQLSSFIREASGGELPLMTEVLLALSKLLVHGWPVLLAAPFVIGLAGWGIYTRLGERSLLRLDRLKLRLPVVGGIIERIVLARFTSLLGTLYESGVPVLHALQVSRDAAGNRWIARGIERVHDEIVQGQGLSDAFAAVEMFPTLVLRMVRIGEATGELDKALANVSYFYNREIQAAIDRIQALVEPLLTVTLGLLLGWLMMAVLGPIYDLLGKIRF
ncbi:MAG: type II secretion system F family protein [Lautropia sp.]